MERKTKGYTEDGILAQLRRKSDIRVVGKQIQQLIQGKGDIGHGTKGKIDFLVNYCNYIHFFVEDFKF